jgi:hypothetical protein
MPTRAGRDCRAHTPGRSDESFNPRARAGRDSDWLLRLILFNMFQSTLYSA